MIKGCFVILGKSTLRIKKDPDCLDKGMTQNQPETQMGPFPRKSGEGLGKAVFLPIYCEPDDPPYMAGKKTS